jgi:hypothetical protein
MNLHGMYRWFGVVPQGCVLLFPSFFVVISELFVVIFVVEF